MLVYRISWVESLGDLARYRTAISELVTSKTSHSTSLTHSAVSQVVSVSDHLTMSISADDTKASQISHSPVLPKGNSPSVGIEAARAMELPPEREMWRKIAREWYSNGLIEYPGAGGLHHHMGSLCKEFGEGEELRGLYHFIKRYALSSLNLPRELIHKRSQPPLNSTHTEHCSIDRTQTLSRFSFQYPASDHGNEKNIPSPCYPFTISSFYSALLYVCPNIHSTCLGTLITRLSHRSSMLDF